ncbi:HTH myb-type domain-containing protein [Psidium guajava]|nr:HTH myb-type domain-containing protein [Psidium guajava]
MATPSSDSEATPFSSEFLTLCRGLIVRLNFTHAYFITQPKVLAEIMVMVKSGEPCNVPPTHPLRMDIKEFSLIFDHGLQAFQEYKTKISTFPSLE